MDSLFCHQRILNIRGKTTALKLIYIIGQILFVMTICPYSSGPDPSSSTAVIESIGVQRITSSLLRKLLEEKDRYGKPNNNYLKELKNVRIRVKGENLKHLIQLRNRIENNTNGSWSWQHPVCSCIWRWNVGRDTSAWLKDGVIRFLENQAKKTQYNKIIHSYSIIAI